MQETLNAVQNKMSSVNAFSPPLTESSQQQGQAFLAINGPIRSVINGSFAFSEGIQLFSNRVS